MSYINTETKQYNISEAEIRALYPYTMFGVPFVAPEPFVWVFPTPVPQYDPKVKNVIEKEPLLTEKGHYEQTWEIVDLPAEVITANTEAELANNAKIVSDKIEELWAATDKYVKSYISGVAIGILTIGVIQQKPKCIEVSNWSNRIWSEYYIRKDAITVDSELNLDFSSFGSIPYTIPELKIEVFDA